MMLSAKWRRMVIVATTLLILLVVNAAIWEKEQHLAEGEVVYLALAPVDPRSLMQGDYMALNFALSNEIRRALQSRRDDDASRPRDGYAIVRLDEQRVAQFQRLAEGESTLDNDERRLHYRLRNGQVRLATDAFFFQEGHAERYEAASYGRFRLNAQGEPLLESLHDDDLDALGDA
ncbi:GDYXXLXY domain-containing protein [Halovibrio sp. HP20-50]|uniref:GDYXXLXY domain-containing protein n=1 Tax=Halovibrio sp. HP20-59 TaxID=3080275 RepID=UPI00294AAF1B|nr:GDYXXLXY domain-containing protein [Halovibrio sp. HP20-59]MEA2119008.1 GDYXXLXY domain-containing protein [Halovibrio sp. HP20-59]